MREKHHPVFYNFRRFSGEIPRGHEPDFLGTTARPEFVARPAIGGTLPVETEYPSVNEEYFEWIDLLESVISAGPEYTMAELGAGFGRWAVRAAFAAMQQQKAGYKLITVEAEPTHAQWLVTHFRDNRLDPAAHTLLHAAVTETAGEVPIYVEGPLAGPPDSWYGQRVVDNYDELQSEDGRNYMGHPVHRHSSGWKSIAVRGITLEQLLEGFKTVDLVDMDIQGHEFLVIAAGVSTLNEKVKRLHIGTHSPDIEQSLRELLSRQGWLCKADYPGKGTSDTCWGPVEFQDGVQSWLNPRLH